MRLGTEPEDSGRRMLATHHEKAQPASIGLGRRLGGARSGKEHPPPWQVGIESGLFGTQLAHDVLARPGSKRGN